MKDTLIGVLIFLLIYFFLGLVIGFIVSADQRANYGKDGCTYRSYLPYTNLGYLAACELTRIRFNNEQPVRLVPPETKEIK
jgi:hypothetical protein